MSIGAGSIRAIKGGLDKVFKIRDRPHRLVGGGGGGRSSRGGGSYTTLQLVNILGWQLFFFFFCIRVRIGRKID